MCSTHIWKLSSVHVPSQCNWAILFQHLLQSDWEKPWKPSSRTADTPAEIRTRHLLNKSQKHYHLSLLAWWYYMLGEQNTNLCSQFCSMYMLDDAVFNTCASGWSEQNESIKRDYYLLQYRNISTNMQALPANRKGSKTEASVNLNLIQNIRSTW
jgi:hypothetical protein